MSLVYLNKKFELKVAMVFLQHTWTSHLETTSKRNQSSSSSLVCRVVPSSVQPGQKHDTSIKLEPLRMMSSRIQVYKKCNSTARKMLDNHSTKQKHTKSSRNICGF